MSSVPSEGVAPPRRRFHFPHSFRGLVTFWNTATILLFTIAILVGLRYGLSYTMLREEDKLLSDDAAEIGLLLDRINTRREVTPPAAFLIGSVIMMEDRALFRWDFVQLHLDRKSESHADRKWFGQIRAGDGTVLARSKNIPDIPLPAAGAIPPNRQTVGANRVAHRRYQLNRLEPLIIDVGASLDGIEEDVTRFTQLIMVAGLLLLILAPLGGFWLAGRVIRPLAIIIAATANLRPRNIHERLPIRKTGDELDQLSMTINGLLDRIADYLARHRDLTANAAHELRSPLAAILSSAEVALHQERTTDEYKELLGSIVEECTRLGSMVQQLLLLAESDAGRLERARDRIRLDLDVLKAVEMFRGVAESHGTSVEVFAPQAVEVTGDAGHLRQVIFNLLDNAIKFTSGGFVRVEVKSDSEEGGVLIITDSGVGIPPEHLPYVFDRFYRGEPARTRLATGGSGLGLSICKALISTNSGSIAIKSEAGRGTEVRVAFPTTNDR